MARTSRGSVPNASLDAHALDNLDLDDMFADGGDDFFGGMDGMDIDLGDMDDMAARKESEPAQVPPAAADSEPDTPKRRKTKRKLKSPHFFEDEDDDYEPTKKKRRPAKASNPKKKNKKVSDEGTKAKTKKGKSADVDPVILPTNMNLAVASTSSVAAAGRFGKRGIPTAATTTATTSKTKKKVAAARPDKPKTAPAPPSSTMQQIISQHPGLAQSVYCGIDRSNTLFYPFMPAMPSEPSLKNRKLYALVDRLHSTFMTQLTGSPSLMQNDSSPVSESEAIFKLMYDATREEKSVLSNPDRSELIGNAVSMLRNTVGQLDRSRLSVDLLAMCALLKRQFDFIQINAANMDKWCKDNFSEADYAEVYFAPPDGQERTSKLSKFTTPLIKVKVVCTGFKEPKTPLLALLPFAAPPKPEPAPKGPKKATSKRKSGTPTDGKIVQPVASIKPPPTYVEMPPSSRRKAMSDLVARIARELEAKHRLQSDRRRQLVIRQQGDAQKVIDDDTVTTVHTGGMWKWLDKAGYFGTISQTELDRVVVEEASSLHSNTNVGGESPPGSSASNNVCLVSRLQSLLVEEPPGSDSDSGDLEDDEPIENTMLADISGLSAEERISLQARSVGLTPQLPSGLRNQLAVSPVDGAEGCLKSEAADNFVGAGPHSVSGEGGELTDFIKKMKLDLDHLNQLNSSRAAFLKQAAVSNYVVTEDAKLKSDMEAAAITSCQTLLRKAKESNKVKNGKPKIAKDDELELPW